LARNAGAHADLLSQVRAKLPRVSPSQPPELQPEQLLDVSVVVWALCGEERIGQSDELAAINDAVNEANESGTHARTFKMDTSIKNLSDAEKYSAAIKSGTKAVPSMLILICHSSQDGDEFDFGSYKVRAAKVAELFAHPRTHFLPNSCFSESLIQAAGMERRWKSIYSHTIALASTDATVVTRACLSALVKPGGVDRNIAVAAKEQLMHEGHKFVKTCSHQKCSCAKTGKAWFACHPVSEASKARTRAFDFPSSEDDTDDTLSFVSSH